MRDTKAHQCCVSVTSTTSQSTFLCILWFCVGRQGAAAGPAPTAVPAQLFDDSPAAAELVMPLKGRRVGVYWRLFEDAQPEVVAACRHALGLLEELGCEVRGSQLSLVLTTMILFRNNTGISKDIGVQCWAPDNQGL